MLSTTRRRCATSIGGGGRASCCTPLHSVAMSWQCCGSRIHESSVRSASAFSGGACSRHACSRSICPSSCAASSTSLGNASTPTALGRRARPRRDMAMSLSVHNGRGAIVASRRSVPSSIWTQLTSRSTRAPMAPSWSHRMRPSAVKETAACVALNKSAFSIASSPSACSALGMNSLAVAYAANISDSRLGLMSVSSSGKRSAERRRSCSS
mmetsp:Transcript_26059/g.66150  ORF Transcript_26059/g.66150 Transcript_26059/m.66150 type:complete len:211 (+) Transcript_26059:256-888(+)